MNLLRTTLLAGVAVAAMGVAGSANAALIAFQQYAGNFGVSTDGFGSTSNAGNIEAFVPVGSTVVSAYLYSSTFGGGQPGGTLGGQAVNYQTALGVVSGLQAYRADVTSIVAPTINGGAGGTYSFAVTEIGSSVDGEALVVVYTNPNLPASTVGILDGFSAQSGDTTSINFATPLDPTAPGFFSELRLGIGFSCCGQASEVSVNGQLITSVAGNNDDSADGGSPANGNLITVGGSDDPFSPANPTYAQDHERYNLGPYISVGDTSIVINTRNPSFDDNIFLAVVYSSGLGGVNQPPPVTSVPEPASLALFGAGLLGLGAVRRRRRQAAR